MATNKNQHFVPRAHLRPFTLGEEGRTINLFNLDRSRAIEGAPVKGQCSRDYFYGKDLVLERWLQRFEGSYARLVATLRQPYHRLTNDDRAMLQQFWLLQHLRTEAVSLSLVQMVDQLDADVGGLPEGYRLNLSEAVQVAVKVFADNPNKLSDLSVCLIRNQSRHPFITSDNPAVMTNRWHLGDRRADLISPGLLSAGMVGLLPLTSEILCLLYDGAMHALPHVGGWAIADREQDIDAFNLHQVLNCNANLYFERGPDGEYVSGLAARFGPQRLPVRYRIHHAILDDEANGVRTYREVSAEEARAHRAAMVHHESLIPTPSQWPTLLHWRAGGYVYDSGTGQGFARRGQRDRGVAYRKIKVRN